MNNNVIIEHARSDEQRAVLEEITSDGVCPFCLENLTKYHKKPINIIGKHWIVTLNQWPYENASLQLLIISRRHVENISDLSLEEWVDWAQVILTTQKAYGITSGAICMRFGDPLETGASVAHLHSQIIVQDPNATEPVRYKIGSRGD